MIILRQREYSQLKDLRKKWEETGNGEDAVNYMNAWVRDVYSPAREEGRFESEPRDIAEAARNYLDSKEHKKKTKLNKLYQYLYHLHFLFYRTPIIPFQKKSVNDFS